MRHRYLPSQTGHAARLIAGYVTIKKSDMTRQTLHELVDHIPESGIVAAQRLLERLATDASFRTALSAPADDEPVTPGDAQAIALARADLQAGRGGFHHE